MARDQEEVVCEIGANTNGWTQLTNGDATNLKFICVKGVAEVRYTTDGTEPGAADTGVPYPAGQGENKAMADHTTLANAARAWARPIGPKAAVFEVDHD